MFLYWYFLDLSKAFDTIDHDILIDKLQYYGFSGIVKDWLTSFIARLRC